MLGAMPADKAAEGELLWEASTDYREKTRISAYLRWLAAQGLEFGDYGALWRWSVDQPGEFWETIWEYFRLDGRRGDGPGRDRLAAALSKQARRGGEDSAAVDGRDGAQVGRVGLHVSHDNG